MLAIKAGNSCISKFQANLEIVSYLCTLHKLIQSEAHALQTFMNAHGVGEVALAAATSNLFAMLADSYRRSKRIQAGDEIIIHESSHEASSGNLCVALPTWSHCAHA